MLENDETAQNLLIKSTIFSPKHTPQARFAFTGSIVFSGLIRQKNAFPFLHQNMRPLSSLRAESRTPSAGYTPPLPNRPVDCGYASILNRVARLRWIALISWAVFYRYQKTPTRISHFSHFTVKILVFSYCFTRSKLRPEDFLSCAAYSTRSPCNARSSP